MYDRYNYQILFSDCDVKISPAIHIRDNEPNPSDDDRCNNFDE